MVKERYIPIIKEEARTLRKQAGFDENSVIGDYIFSILQKECIVLQEPEPKLQDVDGFSTEKVVNGKLWPVVFINTFKNIEKQNFCAAHELGHQRGIERLIRDKFPDDVILTSDIEDIMNRFAAEFLMPEKDFHERSVHLIEKYGEAGEGKCEYSISVKNMLEVIIRLMDFYYVPYKAVLYRLEEVKVLSAKNRESLEKYEEAQKDVVTKMIQESGITRLRTPSEKVQISVPVSDIETYINDPEILMYMGKGELRKYLKEMKVSEKDIVLGEEIREIEIATMTLKNLEGSEEE